MKKSNRTYLHYLHDISKAISDIEMFISDCDYARFSEDLKTTYAVVRALEVIGEATKSLPESLRKKYPSVPWKDMAGMRDVLIHHYFGIDPFTIWETIKNDLPTVKLVIASIIKDHEQ
jgi:uncharacterized protein with HEPN domain